MQSGIRESQLVGPAEGTTPAPADGASRAPRPIPADLLREASERLKVMVLLGAVLWVVGTIAFHIVLHRLLPGDPRWRSFQPFDAVCLFTVSVSLALYAYLRSGERDPRRVLDLGLGYLIVGALGVGVVWHLDRPPIAWEMQPTITWVGPMLLVFAAIVPTTPRRMLAAALFAASMNPIGMLVARERGTWIFGSATDVVLMHYPDFIIAGVAAVISGVMTRLGQQVAKARELGSYRLGDLLGQGGMGEVYRATHRMLARPAAIKLIRTSTLGTGEQAAVAVRRFWREAEVAASLRSPHTVELYDFGVTADETLYIVMELLEGMTLEELVRSEGRQPP